MIEACKADNAKASAVAWFRDHRAELGGVSEPIWLQCVLESLGPRKMKEFGVSVSTDELMDRVFNGNVLVRDILLTPA